MNRVFPTRGCPTANDWLALMDGLLPADDIVAMELHLEDCAACAATLPQLVPQTPAWIKEAAQAANDDIPSGEIGYVRMRSELRAIASTISQKDEPKCEDVDWKSVTHAGDYEIGKLLGKGGMGRVYRAWQVILEREVAVKMLSLPGTHSPVAMQRLIAEARRLAHVQHPNIVQVYDVGEKDGVPFFSMELVEGETLRALNRNQPLDSRRVAALTKIIAEAVEAAHVAGVIHRDLKPSNILMTQVGEPKISDFGLAMTRDEAVSRGQRERAGTAEYMAPEQWAGDAELIGPKTDVYGLGGILYELLTGQPPFPRDPDVNKTRKRVLYETPVLPRQIRRKVPCDLEAICLRCLDKSPDRRYPTAQAVADDLGRFLSFYPVAARPTKVFRRALLQCRRVWKPLTVAAITLVFAAGIAVPYFKNLADQRSAAETKQVVAEAEAMFEAGSRNAHEGRVRAGIEQMQQAAELLPPDRTVLGRFYRQSIARWENLQPRTLAGREHNAVISSALCSPTGQHVFFGDRNGAAYLWHVQQDTLRRLVSPDQNKTLHLQSIVFNASGTRCAATDLDSRVRIWEVATGAQIGEFRLEKGLVVALAFLGAGEILVTGSTDIQESVQLWSIGSNSIDRTGQAVNNINSKVAKIVSSPDGSCYIVIAANGHSWLCDKTGKQIHDIGKVLGQSVQIAGFSTNGSSFAVVGSALFVCETSTASIVRSLNLGPGETVADLVLQPNQAVSLVIERMQQSWVRHATPNLLAWDDFPVESASISAGGAAKNDVVVLAGKGTTSLRLGILPKQTRGAIQATENPAVGRVFTSFDGRHFLTRATETRLINPAGRPKKDYVQIWDRSSHRLIASKVFETNSMMPMSIAQSRATPWFAVGYDSSGIEGSPLLFGKLENDGNMDLRQIDVAESGVNALALSNDAGVLFHGSTKRPRDRESQIVRQEIGTRKKTHKIPYSCTVNVLALSPDGQLLAVGGSDGSVALLTANQLDAQGAVPFQARSIVCALDFSSDGRFLAIGTNVGRVFLCNVDQTHLSLIQELPVPNVRVSSVRFVSGKNILLTSSTLKDSGVTVWNTEVWRPIGPALNTPGTIWELAAAANPLEVAAWTADGRLMTMRLEGVD